MWHATAFFSIGHFFILGAKQAFISFIGVPPCCCPMFHYMFDARLFLQPQPLPHREHITGTIFTAATRMWIFQSLLEDFDMCYTDVKKNFVDIYTTRFMYIIYYIYYCIIYIYNMYTREGADKSLTRTTSRSLRTESIVSLERWVCSCAEL